MKTITDSEDSLTKKYLSIYEHIRDSQPENYFWIAFPSDPILDSNQLNKLYTETRLTNKEKEYEMSILSSRVSHFEVLRLTAMI
jgi:hypothetical protein